jgi:hypothetical protein
MLRHNNKALYEANQCGESTPENVLASTPDDENSDLKIYVFEYTGKTAKMNSELLKHVASV